MVSVSRSSLSHGDRNSCVGMKKRAIWLELGSGLTPGNSPWEYIPELPKKSRPSTILLWSQVSLKYPLHAADKNLLLACKECNLCGSRCVLHNTCCHATNAVRAVTKRFGSIPLAGHSLWCFTLLFTLLLVATRDLQALCLGSNSYWHAFLVGKKRWDHWVQP